MSNPASAGTLSAGGAGATAADSFPIYWEKQESALCGMHTINNLLQEQRFSSQLAASQLSFERARQQLVRHNVDQLQSCV